MSRPYEPLEFRQSRFFTQKVTVHRKTQTYSAIGKPTDSWAEAATEVPCHLHAKPSQYDLEGFIHAEGDNIFTLDVWVFHAEEAVRPDDVLEVTTGHSTLVGQFWKIRGDLKPLTWFADSRSYVAARLDAAPSGIS